MTDTTPAPIGAPVPRYKIGYRSDEWGERSSTPGGIPDPAGAWVRYDDHAAALSSAAQPAVPPPGYALVPEEPTDEWISALSDRGMRIGSLQSAIRDVLAAAPKAAPQQEAQEPVAWRIDSQVVRGRYITFDEHPGLAYPNAQPLYTAPQPAPAAVAGPKEAVAYLDIGEGGYLDLGSDLSDEALRKLPKGRHMLAIVGTYGVDGYVPVAAPTAKAAIAGEYPPLPQKEIDTMLDHIYEYGTSAEGIKEHIESMLHAYVAADRGMRARAAPLAQGDAEDAARWRMAALIGNEVMLHPDKRTHATAVKAYMDATHSGSDLTGAVDAALAAQEASDD